MRSNSVLAWAINALRAGIHANSKIEALIVRLVHFLKLQNIDNKVFSLLQRSGKKPYTTYRDWAEATLQAKLPMPEESSSTPTNPPRLFVVSPTPPAKSGVATYSMALAKSLQKSFQIVQVSEAMPEPLLPIKWMRPNEFLVKWQPGDSTIYHFGNNGLHHFQEELLAKIPGVVDLHDVNLRDYQISKYGNIEAEEIVEQLIHQKEPQVSGLKLDSREDLPDLNRRVIFLGTHIIVHNEAAKDRILADNPHLSQVDVSVIMLAREDRVRPTRKFAREGLGYRESDLVISTFGFAGKSKQTVEILRAVNQLNSLEVLKDKSIVFNVVGEVGTKSYLRILKTERGPGSGVQLKLTGWVNEDQYATYLAATDLAVQLRSSESLESSATILDCLFSGLPTVISGTRANEHFPDEFLFRTTDEGLLQTLKKVVGNLEAATDTAFRARELAVERYGFEATVKKYVEAINVSKRHKNTSILERETRELRRVFVDVTSTAVGDSRTGIPRVVKRIVGEWLKNMDVTSVEFVPVYFSPSHSKFYSAERFRASILGWSLQQFSPFEVVPKLGDVYLGLDLQVSDQVQGELFKWKEVGANAYFVLYDLLPVTNPSFFPDDVLEGFKNWARMTAEFDGVFAISQTALQDYLQNIAPTRRNLRTGVFRLGSDFTTTPKDHLSKKADPSSKNPIKFLMVGTLEPRKGHREVLEGFHKLWNEGFEGGLTIVGKWGWKIDDLRAIISKSPFKGRLLRVVNNADDVELANLYRDSDCLIAASYNEGFGLPLVEATQMGLAVFARDTPIFREVGGDSLDYFNSNIDFSQQLADWSRNYKFDKQTTAKKLEVISWKQSADALLTLIYPENNLQKSS
jgi:glycosyltransferase involved in cell wall biosynthesis